MNKIPYFAISSKELAAKPELGETIACSICGGAHLVEQTRQDGISLQFYHCNERLYLAGINGKEI